MSSSAIANEASAKTPDARMLNQVAETLTNGEIITNTGLIGLPVHYKDVSSIANNISNTMSNGNQYNSSTIHAPAPLVNIQMAMPDNNSHNNAIMPMMSGVNSMLSNVNSGLPNPFTPPPVVPNIADLADMYNNTIAAASTTEMGSETGSGDTNSHNANESSSSKEPAIHVPEDPASYLPSIFIKEEPPHGCLKQGKKPTFREWANKMLKKPVDAIKEMFGGESGDGIDSENVAGGSGGSGGSGGGDGGGSSNGGAKKLNDNSSNENTTGMRVKIRKTLKKKKAKAQLQCVVKM
jgi:hypothetical protein